jgi:hypothetical protein
MVVDDIYKIISITIGSIGSASVLIIFLSSWLGKVWAARILESDRSKFSQEIENLKINHQAYLASHTLINSTILESKKVFVEKRICAIEETWNEFLASKKKVSAGISFLDVLREDEYHEFRDSPKLRYITETTTIENTLSFMPSTIDKYKIFLDEQTYIIIGGYFGIAARLCFYIQQICAGSTSKKGWREDKRLLMFCRTILNDVEMNSFIVEKWETSKLLGVIESKLSIHLKELCLVEDIVNDTISTKIKISHSIQEVYNEISRSDAIS